jgi:hypothetical protein
MFILPWRGSGQEDPSQHGATAASRFPSSPTPDHRHAIRSNAWPRFIEGTFLAMFRHCGEIRCSRRGAALPGQPASQKISSWMLSGSRNTTTEYGIGLSVSITPECSTPSSSSQVAQASRSRRPATPKEMWSRPVLLSWKGWPGSRRNRSQRRALVQLTVMVSRLADSGQQPSLVNSF